MITIKNGIDDLAGKHSWALYSLQSLPPTKLAQVVNCILKGNVAVLNPLRKSHKRI